MSTCCAHTHEHASTHPQELTVGRRRFTRLAALGGLGLFFAGAPARADAPGDTEALLLSCMDYRLVDDVTRFMDSKGMTDKYNHVALAGASASAVHPAFAAWHDTFYAHVKVAIDLHHIKKVIVIDHRDCGAYVIAVGPDHLKDAETERAAHADVIQQLAARIKAAHPELAFEAYLMALDGSAEPIAV